MIISALVAVTEAVGPYRLWISGILICCWLPFMIWYDARPSSRREEWREVFMNVLLIVLLVNLAPAMWHIACILGVMLVQTPAPVAQPRTLKQYVLLIAMFVTGMAVSGYLHNPPLWKLTLGCVTAMYPAILLFDYWQTQQHQHLQARGAALDSMRLVSSGIAHDFNNYLTSILGNAEIALADVTAQPASVVNQRTSQALDNVVTGVEKARQLAHQLLSSSQLEPASDVVVNLQDELRSLTELLTHFVQKRSTINFTSNDPQHQSLVLGSPVLLQQLFMNLIINAKESTACEVVVSVSIERVTRGKQTTLLVVVADNGDGISQAMQDRMFEPYISSKGSGHGLGLAAAREIVQKHGGEIAVDSEEGRGTQVSVSLPGLAGEPSEEG